MQVLENEGVLDRIWIYLRAVAVRMTSKTMSGVEYFAVELVAVRFLVGLWDAVNAFRMVHCMENRLLQQFLTTSRSNF